MTSSTVELYRAAAAELAEGPVWDASTGTLIWVDILAARFWLEKWGSAQPAVRVDTESHVGAALPTVNPGELLLLLRDGFYLRNSAGHVSALSRPELDFPEIRFNDGKISPEGRAFGGTMPYDVGPFNGTLYRLDGTRLDVQLNAQVNQHLNMKKDEFGGYRTTKCVEGLGISNGIGWSPDGRIMYLVNSIPGDIWRYNYEPATGEMSNGVAFVFIPDSEGMPDGLTVDDSGCIWVAIWGAGKLHRYRPNGVLDRVVDLPVSQPTSMCFVGARLDTLLITSATYGLSVKQLANEPLAGGLFVLNPGITGPGATLWQN